MPAAIRTIREVAAAVGAPLHELDRIARLELIDTGLSGTALRFESRAWGNRTLRVPLAGEHQARNALLAAELLALLPGDVRPDWGSVERAFAALRWPGRLQLERIRGTTWLLDVGHNPAGVETLARALDELALPAPRVLVFGVLADKDWAAMLSPLLDRVEAAVLTVPRSSPGDRRWDPEPAAEWAARGGRGAPRVIPDLPEAIARASTLAPHGTVIVTGSFHTVGEALAALGLPSV